MKWDNLTMSQKQALMKIYVNNGVTNLDEIRNHYNRFDEGGEKEAIDRDGVHGIKPLVQGIKSYIMDVAQSNQSAFMSDYYDKNYTNTSELKEHMNQARKGLYDDLYQSTFLFSKDEQRKAFENHGYIVDDSGNYGLVKKAVGERNLPIYKKNKDVISRDELEVLFNPESAHWLGSYTTALEHSGNYPSAVYIDKEGNLYQNAWDLNDYGVASAGSEGAKYEGFRQILANTLDKVGNPFVVTTGIQPVDYNRLLSYGIDKKDPNLVEMAYSKLDDSVRDAFNEDALIEMYSDFILSSKTDKFVTEETKNLVHKDKGNKHYIKAIPFEEFKKNIDKYYSKEEQIEFGYYKKPKL